MMIAPCICATVPPPLTAVNGVMLYRIQKETTAFGSCEALGAMLVRCKYVVYQIRFFRCCIDAVVPTRVNAKHTDIVSHVVLHHAS